MITQDDHSGQGTDWLVEPAPLAGPAAIDCGLAGTVMRFVPALAATATGASPSTATRPPARRPMATVLDALRALGARIDGDALPFTLHGTGALRRRQGRDRRRRRRPSSSPGCCCPARAFDRGRAGGPRRQAGAVAAAHRDDRAGRCARPACEVDDAEPNTWRVAPGPVAPRTDRDRAGPVQRGAVPRRRRRHRRRGHRPGLAARTDPGRRRDPRHARPDGRLGRPGADRSDGPRPRPPAPASTSTCTTSASSPRPSPPSPRSRTGPSRLRGIAHLRGHETDRLAALATEITALGGDVEETDDGLTIRPARCTAGRGAPTPTTGWRRRARIDRAGRARRAGRRRRVAPPRPSPGFDRLWAALLDGDRDAAGGGSLSTLGDDWDERRRPGAARARRPAPAPRPGRATPTRSRRSSPPSTAAAAPALVERRHQRAHGRDGDAGPRAGPHARSSSATGSGWSATPTARRTRSPGSSGSPSGARVLRRTRTTPTRSSGCVVANADQLVIVSAVADPVPRTGFIDRCLVAAYAGTWTRCCA